MLTSIGRGQLRSLEDLLFLMEVETQGSRQPPNVEKIMECLLDSTSLRIGSVDLLFNKRIIRKNIERASLQPKQRKKLSKSLERDWGNNKEGFFLVEYLTHCQCSIDLKELIGFSVGPFRAHFSHELCRLRHVLGLADAIHLSLFNLGINVSFPKREVRRSRLGGSSLVMSEELRDVLESQLGFTHPKLKRMIPSKGGFSPRKVVNRLTTKDRRFRLILHFLRVFPKGKMEKEETKS